MFFLKNNNFYAKKFFVLKELWQPTDRMVGQLPQCMRYSFWGLSSCASHRYTRSSAAAAALATALRGLASRTLLCSSLCLLLLLRSTLFCCYTVGCRCCSAVFGLLFCSGTFHRFSRKSFSCFSMFLCSFFTAESSLQYWLIERFLRFTVL